MKNILYCLVFTGFLTLNNIILSCKKSEPSLSVKINSISPVAAGNNDIVTINGLNLINNDSNPKVELNGVQLEVVKVTANGIDVKIPKLVGSGIMTLTVDGTKYQCPEFTYKYKTSVTTIAGSGSVGSNDGTGSQVTFNAPWGIAADNFGNLYVADVYNRLIRKISANDHTVTTITIHNTIDFKSPYNIAIDDKKNMYVTDFNESLLKITVTGEQSVLYNGTMPNTGIAVSTDGFLYMSNNSLGTILKLNDDGRNISTFTSGLITPRNIIFDKSDNMYVSAFDGNTSAAAIYKIDKFGKATLLFTDKGFEGWEIAIDDLGNIYEADHFHNAIRIIGKNGKAVVIAGSGNPKDVDGLGLNASFDGPRGITIDKAGDLYVTTYNEDTKTGNKVRKIVVE